MRPFARSITLTAIVLILGPALAFATFPGVNSTIAFDSNGDGNAEISPR